MQLEILKLENLSKYYTAQTSVVMGLSNVSLSFATGEFVAVTGESGSGKSTLAKVLGGILPYESGELSVFGKPTSHYDARDWESYRRDMIAYISQSYGILEGNTVLENVESALRFSGVSAKEATVRAKEILSQVELSDLQKRRAGKLSSGQKQRLSIARALAKPSKILIADEPTGNLDRENSNKVIELLKKASADHLVILVTHEFEEAADVVTRHITLSDGGVVSDVSFTPPTPVSVPHPPATARHKGIGSYVSYLTAKARPIFSSLVCLLLALSSFMTFALLGTFIVALDDTPTKIYSSDAFYNGNPDRLVLMKPHREAFDESDYQKILSATYVQSVERWGYVNDIHYYYQPDVDYRTYKESIQGPNYHAVKNPDDILIVEAVELKETNRFLQTVPFTNEPFLTNGELPTDVYEVVSADPAYRIGDTLKIYIKNKKDWGVAQYVDAIFRVVGETDMGSGFYFSDRLAAALSNHSTLPLSDNSVSLNNERVMVLPYVPESFTITAALPSPEEIQNGNTDQTQQIPVGGKITLGEQEFCASTFLAQRLRLPLGALASLKTQNQQEYATLRGLVHLSNSGLILVSHTLFEKLLDMTPNDQVSIYIKDYAYADRVENELAQMGYLSVSPFRLGATQTDSTLSAQRLVTLGVCLGALLLTAALQIILLRTMFASLHSRYRLMSDIGLTAIPATRSLVLLLSVFTLIGEALGACCILLLNECGIPQITGIFKYMETAHILGLFAVHLIAIILAFLPIVTSMRSAVFAKAKLVTDIDIMTKEEREV